jgi:UDP-N-acetylenolpyruvoylglucosamine reductase
MFLERSYVLGSYGNTHHGHALIKGKEWEAASGLPFVKVIFMAKQTNISALEILNLLPDSIWRLLWAC